MMKGGPLEWRFAVRREFVLSVDENVLIFQLGKTGPSYSLPSR